jgi:ribosome-binding ATPase YchF (GTP1/OBG family)
VKISIIGIEQFAPGKKNVKDPCLDQADKLVSAKKKTYVQVELVSEDEAMIADSIVVAKSSLTDLILRDLEFVETRISRCENEKEKDVLNKMKTALEKEQFVSKAGISNEEFLLLAGAGFLTNKPVITVEDTELEDQDALLNKILKESGYISFLTVGDKENRAWLIKKGATAWEAAGVIHSDIQRGFIRAEIIAFDDFIKAGGENQAKQAGKVRLEQKDYVMQDHDLANFRFNK